MEPVAPSQRIVVLDVVRGVALFGILVVNFYHFFHPWNVPAVTASASEADRLARFLIDFLFDSKFYPIFAFLFGAGMFLQMRRAAAADLPVTPFFARRMAVLAAFGFAHGILLWTGDILLVYAVGGFVMLLAVRRGSSALARHPRATLYWALGLIAAPILMVGMGVGLLAMAHSVPSLASGAAEMDRDYAKAIREGEAEAAEEMRTYSRGTYAQITGLRLRRYLATASRTGGVVLPMTLGLFLLGWRAAWQDWFRDAAAQRRLVVWALPSGLALSFFAAASGFDAHHMSTGPLDARFFLQFVAHDAGGVVLSQAYVAGLALLFERWRSLAAVLAAAGRMALTNYLMQSVIVTTVAYGYGGGWYGQVGTAAGLGWAIVLFAVQAIVSGIWLRRFRFGPAEWLWRSLTLGRGQALIV